MDDFHCRSYCLLNMFRAPLCPSSGAWEYYTGGCWLWYLVLWLCVRFAGCSQKTGHTTLSSTPYRQLENQAPNTTGSNHLYNTLDLLTMGIVVPETCWASNKICNKNHLLHLVGILFPHINDDTRSKSHQMQTYIRNLIKIRPVAAELFHAVRQTNRNDKDIITFRKFARAPKIITAANFSLYRLSTFYGHIPVSQLLPYNMKFTQLLNPLKSFSRRVGAVFNSIILWLETPGVTVWGKICVVFTQGSYTPCWLN